VGLRLLRSLDPAVKSHLTRRPLRRLAERASPFRASPVSESTTYQVQLERPGLTSCVETKLASMGKAAVGKELVLPPRRSCKLAVALFVAAILVGPAPLGHAAPGPPPQPPVPVIDGPNNSHHRRHQPSNPPPAPPEAPPGAPS
jgi:hypothetical protein